MQTPKQRPAHLWPKGRSGNPAGRPVSRRKVAAQLQVMLAGWPHPVPPTPAQVTVLRIVSEAMLKRHTDGRAKYIFRHLKALGYLAPQPPPAQPAAPPKPRTLRDYVAEREALPAAPGEAAGDA